MRHCGRTNANDAAEAHDHLVQIWMALRVLSDFKKRFEYVVQQGLEGEGAACRGVFGCERLGKLSEYSRNLNHPLHSFGEEIVTHEPRRQHIPFIFAATINAQPWLEVHVIVNCCFSANHFFCDVCKKAAFHSVVVLQEHFTQTPNAKRLVLLVELVEALPHGGVGAVAHPQCLQAEVANLNAFVMREFKVE